MSSVPPPPPPYWSPAPPPPPGQQPSQPVGQPRYATFLARLGGHILDNLLYGALLSVFLVPGIIMAVVGGRDCVDKVNAANGADVVCDSNDLNGGLIAGGIGLIAVGVVIVAAIYLRSLARTGQTWGRRIVGVRVVRKDSDGPLGFGTALGRCLLESILGQLCFLNYLWMLWDNDSQTWHDKIVNTIVVKV